MNDPETLCDHSYTTFLESQTTIEVLNINFQINT